MRVRVADEWESGRCTVADVEDAPHSALHTIVFTDTRARRGISRSRRLHVASLARMRVGLASLLRTVPLLMSTTERGAYNSAVVWDVDGTLVESTDLGFEATNEVLARGGHAQISRADYLLGCRYTTPDRFSFHVGEEIPNGERGAALGADFDATYARERLTAGLFRIERLLRCWRSAPQGALSNAAGAYVQAVLAANELEEVPGERMALFGVALGADEVPAGKPAPDGLQKCCAALRAEPGFSVYVGDSPSDGKAARAAGMKAVGVLWGANGEEALRPHFDELAADVDELIGALRRQLGDEKA